MTGHGKVGTQKERNVPALRIGMKFMHKLSRRPRYHKSSVSRCHRRKSGSKIPWENSENFQKPLYAAAILFLSLFKQLFLSTNILRREDNVQ